MYFRGGEHQGFEQHLTPQIATLKSKCIFAEWGVISRGTDTSTPLLSLFCFWISYKYSAAAISLSSENLSFFFLFSFYFLPLRCKLFLIFVSCEWKLKEKITLPTEGKLKYLWILFFAIGLLGRFAVFSTWQLNLADKQLKASMPTPHSRSKTWGLQCTALFFSCSKGWF